MGKPKLSVASAPFIRCTTLWIVVIVWSEQMSVANHLELTLPTFQCLSLLQACGWGRLYTVSPVSFLVLSFLFPSSPSLPPSFPGFLWWITNAASQWYGGVNTCCRYWAVSGHGLCQGVYGMCGCPCPIPCKASMLMWGPLMHLLGITTCQYPASRHSVMTSSCHCRSHGLPSSTLCGTQQEDALPLSCPL